MGFRFIRNTDRKVMVIAIGAGTLLFLHWLGFLAPVEKIIRTAFNPILATTYSANDKIRTSYKQATEKRDLSEEIKKVEAENKKLLIENASLQYLREENKILRKYVNLFDEAKYKYVLGRVVSRQAISKSNNANNKLIIDKGINDGLLVGLLVINEEGLAIGKITKAKDNLAEVALITSKDCKLSVARNESQKTIGIASGDAGLTIKVDYIPQTEVIKTDDVLVTSGLEGDIPHGFVVGKISEINKTSSEIWQTAIIEPTAGLDDVRVVSVLLPIGNFDVNK